MRALFLHDRSCLTILFLKLRAVAEDDGGEEQDYRGNHTWEVTAAASLHTRTHSDDGCEHNRRDGQIDFYRTPDYPNPLPQTGTFCYTDSKPLPPKRPEYPALYFPDS